MNIQRLQSLKGDCENIMRAPDATELSGLQEQLTYLAKTLRDLIQELENNEVKR